MDHDNEPNQNKPNPNEDGPTGPRGYMKLAGIEDGQYDALADLFLGQSELAPEPFSQTGTDSIGPATNSPVRFKGPSDDSLIPDRPIEIMPRINEAKHDLDPNPKRHLCIEAVLLGHLPVRASLWVRQYACSTARRRGEVIALIRAAAGSTSVDLISGSQDIKALECGSLQEALSRVNTIADRVILRVDETTEPELLDRQEINEITILTGADEAAIVASYRLIKTLTNAWDTDEMTDPPHIRLAVMGATSQQVADASAKLSRAVDAFLDRPIEIIDAAGRIDATETTNIFRDTVAHQATSILDELVKMSGQTVSIHAPEMTPFIEPQIKLQVQPQVEPQIEAEDLAAAYRENTSVESQAPISIKQPATTGLATMIAGLTRLETRCPFALDVELCVDITGSLHIIAGDEHDGPMARLETVRAWVRDHLSLILRVEPKLAFPDANDRSSEIGLHLISADPHTLRGLIDSPVRMYALAEVTVGGQSAKIATPIN